MIDFRYHLVSIISIFLALAVGIVLGAGPLQQNLGTTLQDQVAALRTEKQELNETLTLREKQLAAADDYAQAVGPRVVHERLTGHSVVVVELPAAEARLIDVARTSLLASGATVRGTVSLTESWFDPDDADERATAATAAATALGMSTASTGDRLLMEVLSRIVGSTTPVEPSDSRATAIETLASAGLIEVSDPQLTPGDLVAMLSGDFAGTQDVVTARGQSVRSLVRLVDAQAAAMVVAGGRPMVAAGQPVTSNAVSAVRADSSTSNSVSTVDHAGQGGGPALIVLALETELAGTVGHYGVDDGATAAAPQVSP